MSFDNEKLKYGKEHINIIELDVSSCTRVYSVGGCKAGLRIITTTAVSVDDFNVGDTIQGQTSGAEGEIEGISGPSPIYTFSYRVTNGIDFSSAAEDVNNITATGESTKNAFAPLVISSDPGDECYNTLETCVDVPNYDATIKTYRFCEQRSPHPIGLDAIPNILKVNTSPTEIDLSGGLGVRAFVNATFQDHPHADFQFEIDKYLDNRTYNAYELGTFWTKFRARNPNYQFRDFRLLSGYLVGGVYNSENFETRYYVNETLNATRGQCNIVAKDPLRLAMPKKSLCPAANTGRLDADITAGQTTFTVEPSGIVAEEGYTIGDFVSIGNEVMEVTNIASDDLTVTRGQYSTVAVAHSEEDTVQRAYFKNDQVNIIVKDLLVNFSNVSSSYINDAAWQTEVDTYLSGLLEGIVIKPTDVNVLLKELSQDMPHYLYWDEKAQLIQLKALKAPPETANTIDMDGELVEDKTVNNDKPDMRISTVFIHFGKDDPTKKITETNNYKQTYIRIDSDSIEKYENNQTRTIFSRWISNDNKSAAVQLATLIGRRFSDTPKMINFTLDAKDSNFWAGQNALINHRDTTDFTGQPLDTLFQIMSTKQKGDEYIYKALEYRYGPLIDGDSESGVDLVYVPSGTDQNLRDIYDTLFPSVDGTTEVIFIVEDGVVCGGSSAAQAGINTGSWPENPLKLTLQLDIGGFIVGKGGNGAGNASGAAAVGGLGVFLNHDLTLVNNGVIGGGGGGGGEQVETGLSASGGGGAGANTGNGGTLTIPIAAENGTLELGGAGGVGVTLNSPASIGGKGGDLGDAGENGNTQNGGAAGNAIDKNGYTLTQTVSGDIRGAVVA